MIHTSVVRGKDFNPGRPWAALDIAQMNGITVRLHWSDQPYRWHVNDGEEVFVVLDGCVDMHFHDDAGETRCVRLEVGDMFAAAMGCAHVAHPQGPARMLVIERQGSV